MIIDASVLIAHLDERDAHHDPATQLLLDAASRLALLRARTGLELADCCVLLAAGDARSGS